jgi:hypothetical protein
MISGWQMQTVKKIASLLFLFGTSLAVDAGQETSSALLAPVVSAESDSDDFHILKAGGGALFVYSDIWHYTGLQVMQHHYSTDHWSKDAAHVSFINRSINPRNGLGHTINVGLNSLGSHQLLTADMNYSAPIAENTNAEVFLNRDWVETEHSLEDAIHYDYGGGSLEHRINEVWTVIGLTGQQRFSDNNTRTHLRAKIIYDLLPEYGVHLQARHRQYRNSADQGNFYYFNPDEYREDMLALGFRKKISDWMLVGLAGWGREQVEEDDRTATHLYELEVNSPITSDIIFKTRMTYGQSATLSGPDYTYKSLQASLVFPF